MAAVPIYVWNGTAWQETGPTIPASPIAYQASAPSSPSTGDIWVDSDGDVTTGSQQFQRFRFVASGGETTISGADANGAVLAYTAGLEQVVLNGAVLVRGHDYTATTGTTITGLSPALVANDVLEVFSFIAFTVANTYTQSQADGLFGNPLSTSKLLHVRDEKANGTQGGTFTSGAFRTRDLNTVKTNTITGASLASNQITLPTGSYFVDAVAMAFRVDGHIAQLYNISDSSVTVLGLNGTSGPSDTAQGTARVRGYFTIASSKVFELQHRCQTTGTTIGFGIRNECGQTEVYSDVLIWKVA